MKKIQKTLLLLLSTAGISPCSVNAQGSGTYAGSISNCIARWTFDNSSALIIDSSGNNNNGILSNVSSISGWRNVPSQAVQFNGTNSAGTIPNSPSLQIQESMTIVALVKFNGFNTLSYGCQGSEILTKGADFSTGNYILRTTDHMYDDNCNIATPDKNSIQAIFHYDNANHNPHPYLETGKWYFFAAIYNKATQRQTIYQSEMDENMVIPPTIACDFNTIATSIGVNSNDIKLGYAAYNSGDQYRLKGDIDEIVLFDKALSSKEVNDAYLFLWGKGQTTSISDVNNPIAQDIQYYTQNQQLHLASTASNAYQVTLTDMLGRKIGEHTLKDRLTVDLSAYARQIFIVNVYSEKGKYAFKITNE